MGKKPKYYIRPDGLHEAIRTINGKRVAFRGKSDAVVERKMIEYTSKLERGKLFKDIAAEWETEHFPTLSPNTLKGYRPALRRCISEFDNKSVKEITAPEIKHFIMEFARGGRARKTVTTQLLIINLVFSYAVECGERDYNPCVSVSLPKNLSKTKRDAASKEDEERVKKSYSTWLLPYLILYTGLRKGEALALQGKDIHEQDGYIEIKKSVYHINNTPYIKSPKTEAGIRTAPILAPLVGKIPKTKANAYIFSDDDGRTPLTEMQYQKHWSRYAAVTGITCTAHQLRHSFATMLFECDVAVKDAQDMLGHSTAAMTQDIYMHLRSGHKAKVVAKLNESIATQ